MIDRKVSSHAKTERVDLTSGRQLIRTSTQHVLAVQNQPFYPVLGLRPSATLLTVKNLDNNSVHKLSPKFSFTTEVRFLLALAYRNYFTNLYVVFFKTFLGVESGTHNRFLVSDPPRLN